MKKITKDFFENKENEEKTEGIRINKFLADAGIISRRGADKAVEEGRVRIDGELAVMGSKVLKGSTVTLDGKNVTKEEELVLIAFNKPVGIVCTTDRRDPDNIIDFINYGKRIYPIGRLDKDSEGLLLLTNDGDIVNKILRAGNYHEKEYVVTVNKPITAEFIEKMSSGVEILDTVTRPCTVTMVDKTTFRIILTQGLNRQIRRMCEALDYRVRHLERVRIMNINLGRLKTGTYRNLTEQELAELNRLIAHSSNVPTVSEKSEEAEKVRRPQTGRMQERRTQNGDKRYVRKDNRDRKEQDKGTYRAPRQGSQGLRTRKPRDNK